jgi:hypothetical protein
MQFIGIIKRVIPFFLTFAAGLFIASFFVSLSAPSFESMRKSRSERHGKKHCKSDNERLRAENERLKSELELMKQSNLEINFGELELNVPPPPPAPVREVRKAVTIK